jgi:plasmid stabilization system protein ParE
MAAGRRSVVWVESARAALDDVVTHIAQDSHAAAVRFLVAALDTASSLDQYAERGRIVPELKQPDLRELSAAPHEASGAWPTTVAGLKCTHAARRGVSAPSSR